MTIATTAHSAIASIDARRAVLAALASASCAELIAAWGSIADKPAFDTIRMPEIGLVMAQGRVGGGGAPFNVGEVTVTRAAVRSESGHVGFGHILGRDKQHALLVARFDALWQDERFRASVEEVAVAPVRRRLEAKKTLKAQKVAATRVNFFTLVRGEDE